MIFSPSKLVDYRRKRAPDNRIITPRSPRWREIQGSEFALKLNGTTSFIPVTDSEDFNLGNSDFTQLVFVRFDDLSQFLGFMGQTRSGGPESPAEEGFYWYRHLGGGSNRRVFWRHRNTAGDRVGYWFDSTGVFAEGERFLLANTRKGTAFTMSVNGEAQSLTTEIAIGSTTLVDADGDFWLGKDANNFLFDGPFLLAATLKGRALTLDELRKIYENPQSQLDMPGLTGWWRFREGSGVANGTPIRDWSNRQNHGAMQGFSGNPWDYIGVL